MTTAVAGTYQWMSPEVLGHQRYSYANDAYSFGIVLWETSSRVTRTAGSGAACDVPSSPNVRDPPCACAAMIRAVCGWWMTLVTDVTFRCGRRFRLPA